MSTASDYIPDFIHFLSPYMFWGGIIIFITTLVFEFNPITFRYLNYIPLSKAVEKILNKRIEKSVNNTNKEVIPYELWRSYNLFGIRKGASVIEPVKNEKNLVTRIDGYNKTTFNNIEFTNLFIKRKDLKDFLKKS